MRVVLLALLLTFSVACQSAESIGKVTENKGTNCDLVRGKAKLSGAKGASVESLDTYTTQACVSTLTFVDDTKVKVTENSKLLIDDFVFDPKKSEAENMFDNKYRRLWDCGVNVWKFTKI